MNRKEAKEELWNTRKDIVNFTFHKVDEHTEIGLVTRSDEGKLYNSSRTIIDKIYDDFKLELEAEYKRGQEDVLSRSCKFSQVEYELEDERYFCTHPNINFQHLPPYGFGYIRWEQK